MTYTIQIQNQKYLLDTSQVIAEGQNSTSYEGLPLAITQYTWGEIESKRLSIDSSSSDIEIIQAPSFCDFSRKSNIYHWSNEATELQLIECPNFHFKALCGKHNAAYQLSIIGGESFFICESIVKSNADFSQITAVTLHDNLIPLSSRDLCLQKTITSVYDLNNNYSKNELRNQHNDS